MIKTMINYCPGYTVSESTKMSFIHRQYRWDYKYEYEHRK